MTMMGWQGRTGPRQQGRPGDPGTRVARETQTRLDQHLPGSCRDTRDTVRVPGGSRCSLACVSLALPLISFCLCNDGWRAVLNYSRPGLCFNPAAIIIHTWDINSAATS